MTEPAHTAPSLSTHRLTLRAWRADDFPVVAQIYGADATARHIGGVKKDWEAWRAFAAFIGHWTLRGYGFWAVERREDAAVIGWCGLWNPLGWPEPEVGYSLRTMAHGQGYATEAARAARAYAYETLGWTTIISTMAGGNTASEAVARRLGAVRDGQVRLLDAFDAAVWRHPGPDAV